MRRAPTLVAPPYSSSAMRAAWGSCSRLAITRYEVATAKATAVWPEGNDRWLSGEEAAATAPLVYSTGRFRWNATFSQFVEASDQVTAFAITAMLPRACEAERSCAPR